MPSQPTRLPYGLSLVKPFINPAYPNSPPILLQSSASTLFKTPDITNGSYWVASVSGLVTNFLNGEQGRLLYIKCTTGGAVIIQNSAPAIRLTTTVYNISAGILKITSTAGNVTMLDGEIIPFLHDGTGWVMTSPRVVDTNMA